MAELWILILIPAQHCIMYHVSHCIFFGEVINAARVIRCVGHNDIHWIFNTILKVYASSHTNS